MYQLIGTPRSRAMRVIWALEELEQPYAVTALPLGPAARAHHPEGKVPILETEAGAITDSVAIMTFLADRHGGLGFRAGSLERARQDAHTMFLVDALDQVLWTHSQHAYVLPEALRAPDAVAPATAYELGRGFERLVARVGDGPYLMGETFSVPDIVAGHCGGWARVAGFEVPQEARAYLDRCYARPSNARARARAAEALKAAGLS